MEETMKIKFALIGLVALGGAALTAGSLSAMPLASPDVIGVSDNGVTQVKGGHGHGRGHMRQGNRGHHYGWSRGRHRGWR
jgi:hypothetical protein